MTRYVAWCCTRGQAQGVQSTALVCTLAGRPASAEAECAVLGERREESVPMVTWSQKRWHLLLGAIITGWLSLDWGQAAVSAGCGQVRGWSQWNSVWSPVSLLGLYSSLRLPHPLHPAVLWSGVLSFPGTWGSPGGIISLSIKKLAEKAKSPPCQPRLSHGPLCAPWQP